MNFGVKTITPGDSLATGIITERWERLEAVGSGVRQYLIPGVIGVVSVPLTYGIQHQFRRTGSATNDGPTKAMLTADEGRSDQPQTMNTIRYGQISMWLVKTRFINPENRYSDADATGKIMLFEQIWQETDPNVMQP